MRNGFTLIELVVVLAVTGVGVSLLLPAGRAWADRFAVVGAREALVGLLVTARTTALGRGGATLTLDEASQSAWLQVGDSLVEAIVLTRDYGVAMDLTGSRTRANLRFDALGIGRVASQSVRFIRNDAESRVVISSYGGVSRR